ncbi:hypothetical protein BC628DRAFT_142377 [Trametes gibbosa]|nr:hypothetical protein BC628DRAFT_142377 [Trametes gibbosa]
MSQIFPPAPYVRSSSCAQRRCFTVRDLHGRCCVVREVEHGKRGRPTILLLVFSLDRAWARGGEPPCRSLISRPRLPIASAPRRSMHCTALLHHSRSPSQLHPGSHALIDIFYAPHLDHVAPCTLYPPRSRQTFCWRSASAAMPSFAVHLHPAGTPILALAATLLRPQGPPPPPAHRRARATGGPPFRLSL